jgi:hypothetical protein
MHCNDGSHPACANDHEQWADDSNEKTGSERDAYDVKEHAGGYRLL